MVDEYEIDNLLSKRASDSSDENNLGYITAHLTMGEAYHVDQSWKLFS